MTLSHCVITRLATAENLLRTLEDPGVMKYFGFNHIATTQLMTGLGMGRFDIPSLQPGLIDSVKSLESCSWGHRFIFLFTIIL